MKASKIALAVLMFTASCKDKGDPEPECLNETALIGIGLDKNPTIAYVETAEHQVFKLELGTKVGNNAVLTLEDYEVDDVVRLEFKEDVGGCTTKLSGKGPGAGVNPLNETVRKIDVTKTDITGNLPSTATAFVRLNGPVPE